MEHVTQIVLDAKSHTVTLSIYILTKKRENERVRRGRGLSLSLSLSLSLRCNIYYFHRLLTVCWKKTQTLVGRWFGIVLPDAVGWSRDDDDDDDVEVKHIFWMFQFVRNVLFKKKPWMDVKFSNVLWGLKTKNNTLQSKNFMYLFCFEVYWAYKNRF